MVKREQQLRAINSHQPSPSFDQRFNANLFLNEFKMLTLHFSFSFAFQGFPPVLEFWPRTTADYQNFTSLTTWIQRNEQLMQMDLCRWIHPTSIEPVALWFYYGVEQQRATLFNCQEFVSLFRITRNGSLPDLHFQSLPDIYFPFPLPKILERLRLKNRTQA